MGQTLGYITGALAGLGLTLATAYAVDRPKQAEDILRDTQSSLSRGIESIEIGNLGDVIADAGHDIVQRNPERAVEQFDRINLRIVDTPYQDTVLDGSHYKNARDLVDYTDHELQETWSLSDYLPSGLKTKGEGLLGLLGIGTGIVGASTVAAGIAAMRNRR